MLRTMATVTVAPPRVSIEDYLEMSFDGVDAEFVDGVIVERAMPKKPHARAQQVLARTFGQVEDSHGVAGYPELRLRLAPNKVRIPDYCVFRSEPEGDVPEAPPMVAVEIVSQTDVYSMLMEKLAEYDGWGVEHVWLVDPRQHQLAVYREGAPVYVDELSIPEFGFTLSASDLFDRKSDRKPA